jgi:putative oxidoreductase
MVGSSPRAAAAYEALRPRLKYRLPASGTAVGKIVRRRSARGTRDPPSAQHPKRDRAIRPTRLSAVNFVIGERRFRPKTTSSLYGGKILIKMHDYEAAYRNFSLDALESRVLLGGLDRGLALGAWSPATTALNCLQAIWSYLQNRRGREAAMTSLFASLARWRPYALSVLRIVVALLFIQHGLAKFFNFPTVFTGTLSSLLFAQGLTEVIGGLLLLVGIWSRIVAFILSGDMAMVHAPKSVYPLANGGDLAIVFCFVFLYIACAGSGPWSVDHTVLKSE